MCTQLTTLKGSLFKHQTSSFVEEAALELDLDTWVGRGEMYVWWKWAFVMAGRRKICLGPINIGPSLYWNWECRDGWGT